MQNKRVHAARFLYRHKRMQIAGATADDTAVTCLQCLYWARRYIPLAKLRKHREYQIRAHLGNWRAFEAHWGVSP